MATPRPKATKKAKRTATTAATGLRTFDGRDGYQASLRDVYDSYSRAEAGFWLPLASGSIQLSGTMPSAEEPRVVLAWPDPARPERVVSGWLPPDQMETFSAERATAVLEAAAPKPRAEVARTIGAGQELNGQVSGYWYAPEDEVPSQAPSWDPTGALLFRADQKHETPLVALSLVYVGAAWRPLSSAGQFTYVHSSGLARGEQWKFVAFSGGVPTTYRVSTGSEMSIAEIEQQFDNAVAERCRVDYPTLVYYASLL